MINQLKAQLNLLPSTLQAIIAEQNKLIIDKLLIHKQNSLCYSGANSIDGESNVSNSNALQIPTISTVNNNNNKSNNSTAT